MRALSRLTLVAALAAMPADASADSGALFGESARATSLADSVVARPGDTSAIYFNPGGVADIDRPTLALYGDVGNLRLHFARTGELGETTHDFVGGYGLSVAAPLPGPPWLRRVRLGGAVHLPAETIIRVRAPVRADTPASPYYGGRTERTAATVAVAVLLPWTIRLGGAVTVMPNLVAPTQVGYDASRGEEVDEGVIVEQERRLTLEAAFLLGVRVQPIDELGFGLVWRQGGATRATGDFDIRAGAVTVEDEYRFYDFLAPEEVSFGIYARPIDALSLSADATWARWSEYRTIHDERPEPGFNDVVDVRVAAEWNAHRAVAVRIGYGFLPSPVPAQTGRHNFLDAHRHAIAFGLGVDLEALLDVPVRADLAFRFHVLQTQSAEKDPASLPGPTITNLGYPGFTSTGSFSQIALALTFPLGPAVSIEEAP